VALARHRDRVPDRLLEARRPLAARPPELRPDRRRDRRLRDLLVRRLLAAEDPGC
jgi:hypothetical protein